MLTQKPIKYMKLKVNGEEINQRLSDGYINATEMCDVYSKDFVDYSQIRFTKRFLTELSRETKIDKSELIQDKGEGYDIWIHPQVAINLAQWISPKLAVMVPIWVYEWMNKQNTPAVENTVTTKSKFTDYDPEFGKLIDQALSFDPRELKKTSK